MAQQNLAAGAETHGEQNGQPQDHELDAPPHDPDGSPEGSFQIDAHHHQAGQKQQQGAKPAHAAEHQLARTVRQPGRSQQVIPLRDHQRQRQEKGGQQQELPAP